MSVIAPFAALRPTPAAVGRVAAVPYDVVNSAEAAALADGEPLSFLRVSRPEIECPPGTPIYSDAVYAKAADNFDRLRRAAPLVVEDAPSLYVYRLTMGAHVQTGVAAAFSVDEYARDLIKKHEKTRPDKEDDRTRHILTLRAQTGPVFLTYKTSAAVDAVVARVVQGAPLFDFTAVDGIRHEVWRAAARDTDALVAAFAGVPALYIADGHHRAASAWRTHQALAAEGPGEHERFLAVAFPDQQMQVLPYHRVVRDLQGRGADAFRAALAERFTLTAGGPASPARRGQVAMYLAGAWWTIDFGPVPAGLAPDAALDVSRLQDGVLTPLLGIADVRTDKRIDFVGGIRGTGELERLVNGGEFAVAFSLYPVAVDDLMRISDAGGIMPPKSTWFEPKLRDGVLSHLV
ncbi:MAG: DUF1015 domain-containing protein [Vicinamibacterales bacterium]